MDYHWGVLYTAGEWAIRIIMLFYVPYRRDAAAARVWLLLIFFLPYVGLPLYFLFGRAYLPRQRMARQRLLNRIIARLKHETPDAPQVRAALPDYLRPAFELTEKIRSVIWLLRQNQGRVVNIRFLDERSAAKTAVYTVVV